VASALACTVISPDPMKAVRVFLVLSSYAAAFALPFSLVRSKEKALQCLLIIMCSSVIPVTYAFVELATGSAATESGIRLKSTFTHPNIFAFYLVSLLALIMFMLRSSLAGVSKHNPSNVVSGFGVVHELGVCRRCLFGQPAVIQAAAPINLGNLMRS